MNELLRIEAPVVEEINKYLMDPANPLISEVLKIINKYGRPEEINKTAKEARKISNLMKRLENMDSPYIKDLEWLIAERDKGSFVSVTQYRSNVLGDQAGQICFAEGNAVTLEISALQYFPWLILEAKQAIEKQEIMPGRYIRVRNMKEQEGDQGDLVATAAAMQIVGASYVETLDTKGTDGSNVHLGGPETITGYFGGVGQPNQHALKWVDELLYYYTNYGVNQVLNVNSGTMLLGYILHKLGIDISFKVSVFMGNDNPYAVMSTLLMARMFARKDGSTPLEGLNLSNSVNNQTILLCSENRKTLGFESYVRLEHHITETWKNIVRQPYNRREELLEIVPLVPYIAAKHEGGEIEVERTRAHPSDILDYFRAKEEIVSSGDMNAMEQNFLDKHESLNLTARALTEKGLAFIGAQRLHSR